MAGDPQTNGFGDESVEISAADDRELIRLLRRTLLVFADDQATAIMDRYEPGEIVSREDATRLAAVASMLEGMHRTEEQLADERAAREVESDAP